MAEFVWESKEEQEKEVHKQQEIQLHKEMQKKAKDALLGQMTTDYILSKDLDEEQKDLFINLFDMWQVDTTYSKGDKVVYEGLAYEVIQTHKSQSDWLPNELPALYKLFYQTSTDGGTIVIPEWKQPLGGHDAYNTGDLVFHKGKTWESSVDGNVWEPSVYGWIEYVN